MCQLWSGLPPLYAGFEGRAFLVGEKEELIHRKYFPRQREGVSGVISKDFERVFQGGVEEALEIPDFRAFGMAIAFSHNGLDRSAKSLARFRSGDLLVSKEFVGDERIELVFDTQKFKPNWTAPHSQFELCASAWGCWSC